jgi:uncharacterized protein (TIGR03435 family)
MRPLVASLLTVTSISAQTQPAPAFEVATIKAAPARTGTAALIALDTDPAMLRYANVSLKILISMAYRFDSRLIQGGPSWLDEQAYDLSAKLPPGVPKDRVPAMLQTLLEERFKLAVHREMKEQRVYFLVVGKNGPRLKKAETPEENDPQQVRGDHMPVAMLPGRLVARGITVGTLAGVLAHITGIQVTDHTELSGLFDIDLRWTPDNSSDGGASIFTALQEQLGLKLETGKGPVETLLVDHAERNPIEN